MSFKFLMRAYGIFTIVGVMFLSFSLGLDAAKGDWRACILDAILALFWVLLVIFAHTMILKDEVSDIKFENRMKDHKDKLHDLIHEMQDKLIERKTEEVEEVIHDIIMSVVPDKQKKAMKMPTKAQQVKIREQFEKKVEGSTLVFTDEPDGKLGIEIAEKKTNK